MTTSGCPAVFRMSLSSSSRCLYVQHLEDLIRCDFRRLSSLGRSSHVRPAYLSVVADCPSGRLADAAFESRALLACPKRPRQRFGGSTTSLQPPLLARTCRDTSGELMPWPIYLLPKRSPVHLESWDVSLPSLILSPLPVRNT